jgi:hypothetical protein
VYAAQGPATGFDEVLATFAKQYLHILEDGKQLAKVHTLASLGETKLCKVLT